MENQALSLRDMGNHHKHWGRNWGGKKANAPRNFCKCKILYSNINMELMKILAITYNTSLPKLV